MKWKSSLLQGFCQNQLQALNDSLFSFFLWRVRVDRLVLGILVILNCNFIGRDRINFCSDVIKYSTFQKLFGRWSIVGVVSEHEFKQFNDLCLTVGEHLAKRGFLLAFIVEFFLESSHLWIDTELKVPFFQVRHPFHDLKYLIRFRNSFLILRRWQREAAFSGEHIPALISFRFLPLHLFKELRENAAQAPNIDSFVIIMISDDHFWCSILSCLDICRPISSLWEAINILSCEWTYSIFERFKERCSFIWVWLLPNLFKTLFL